MGLTKQYLRYEAGGLFNVIGSNLANIQFLEYGGLKGKLCATAANEHIFIWDIRKGEKVAQLEGEKHEVTLLACSPDKQHLAAGYKNGSIKVFDIKSGQNTITFNGHKSAITALNFNEDGSRLASGAKDTDVIVWDIINESGLFRLKGHKGIVTQVRFLRQANVIISSSCDTFIKFWDLETQHCFRTLTGHETEVWDFITARDDQLLITGASDNEVRAWKIDYLSSEEESSAEGGERKRQKLDVQNSASDEDDEDDEDENDVEDEKQEENDKILTCTKIGSLLRRGKERIVSMVTDDTKRILGFHGTDNQLEIYRINSDEEAKKHRLKKAKKLRKKSLKSGGDASTEIEAVPSIQDDLVNLTTIRLSGKKLRSFDCLIQGDQLKIVNLLSNNSIEHCQVNLTSKGSTAENSTKLVLPGHRSDVRAVIFSSDNTAIASASGEALKVWNRDTLKCIRTVRGEYALTCLFAPGDRHVITGTKSGKLQVYDLAAGKILETIDAHKGAVWSIHLAPDKKSIVSGSADHDVKFWDFELVSSEDASSSKQLSLVHSRTMNMSDEVLCVKFSPDQRLLAVSLTDNTVKVFFVDTLKFFLSMYGHKLPVLSMDISSDSNLLVTASADRNVKLWGLDFGDCHKSIFAHDDSIMCVQFIPKTHMFFTAGKDCKVKQWDGDSFDHIQTLEGHHAEVWALALSSSGNYLVSASHDKSLRIWEKTREPLVLDEEREMEREREADEAEGDHGEPVVAGETATETGIAGRKTAETVKAAERIMEALELYKEEMEKLGQHEAECKAKKKNLPAPSLHPMLQAFNLLHPNKYVLEVLKRVRSSELEEALLVLPFSYVTQFLPLLDLFISKKWEVELCCRCLFFLLRIHHGQITANQTLLPIIDRLRASTESSVQLLKDTVGFNLAGLRFLQQQLDSKEEVMLFADATDRMRQKRKRARKRAVLTIKA